MDSTMDTISFDAIYPFCALLGGNLDFLQPGSFGRAEFRPPVPLAMGEADSVASDTALV